MAGMVNWMQIGNASGQATQAGLQLYNAYRLNEKLKKMDDTYRIPDEISQNLTMAKANVMQGLPQAFQNQYMNQLNNATAQNLSGLSSLKAGLRGVAGANEAQNAGYGNLLAMNSQAQAANQAQLYGQNQNMADYIDQQWVHNVDQPYWRTSDKKDAYFTAAGRQFSNAMASGAGASGNGGGIGQGDAAGGGYYKNMGVNGTTISL